ncbi:imm11 family protein [Sorangium sp. So ce1335]|uniref:imm11 family protein n=1 Tax=Sorangium sp. So ce1335 TaxID=3133335 RepID=UPI003F62E2B6
MTIPRVYKFRYSEGFEWLLPVNDADFELLRFDGQRKSSSWRPIRMKRLKVTEQGRPLEPSDFPACSGGDVLILDRAARDRIGWHLERYGELLPLLCDGGDFWALNVTRLVDALDENNSELLRASDTGAILMVRKHAFRAAALERAELFKVPQMVCGLIYVTDPFVELVRASGLKGLDFVQVWSPN